MSEEPKNRRRRGRTPWWRITRAVALSFDVRKVFLGTLLLILIQAGGLALDPIAPGAGSGGASPLVVDGGPGPGGAPSVPSFNLAARRIAEPAHLLLAPLVRLLSFDQRIAGTWGALLSLLWAVVVTALLGGAISRSAVVELGWGERATLLGSLRFALRSARLLIGGPLLPIAATAFCGAVIAGIGSSYRLPGVGGAVAAVTMFIPLAVGAAASLLLIDLGAAWPLIHASAVADAESALEALTRAFGCVNRRPVQFVACIAALWLMGAAALVFIDFLAGATLQFTGFSLQFTAPWEVVGGIAPLGSGMPRADATDSWTSWAPFFWARVVRLLARGWIYSYFWSAAASIYLALRQDVDGTPWSEIKEEAAPTS